MSKHATPANALSLINVLLFYFFMGANVSLADISINKALVEFKPNDEYYTDIKVFNNADKKAYITIVVKEVINPGQPNEKRISLEDPDKALLIATPTRMVIDGGQSSPVRLLNLDEEQNKERIYRVLVEPVAGRNKSKEDSVQVLVSYDILVIVRPEKPVTNILSSRKGKTITFYNAGNTNIYLEEGKLCKTLDKKNCETIDGNRLYAGASWSIELPFEGDIEFGLNNGETTPRKTFTGKDRLPENIPTSP